jgi:hypothetical protein
MSKLHFSRTLLAGAAGLSAAVALAASAAASTPRISVQSAYKQLYGDFHAMVTASDSQIRADQTKFEKTTRPCLTKAMTALMVAEAPGSADTAAAQAAYKPVLYEATFQMIMQSAKPIVTPYLRGIKLAIEISGLTGAKRQQALAFQAAFDRAANLRTCADANKWAAANYATGSEPLGTKSFVLLESVIGGKSPTANHVNGVTNAQEVAFKKIVKQANKHLQSADKQIENRGILWLALVLLQARADAKQQTSTTSTTTTTTGTTTTPTMTGTPPS